MSQEHDYDLQKKVKISFKGLDYYVMPRYKEHYLNNEYERFSLQILKNNLDKDSLFVDIGAHYGAYSLCAGHDSRSQVIAIEPVAENFELLKENIRVNKLTGLIKAYDYAASDTNGEAEFNIPWASDSAGFYEHPNAQTIRRQKVTTKKIDDVIGQKKADMIKIDTEGHEIGVLRGLKQTLKNNPEVQLIIELNPPLLESAGTDAQALLDAVKTAGKEIYMVDEDKFTLYRITDRLDAWPRYINAGNYANLYCVSAQDHQYAVFISHSSQLGGAEMAMYEQICELRKKGLVSHVILPNKGPLEDKLIDKGIGYTIVEEYAFWVKSPDATNQSEIIRQRNFANIRASVKIADLITDLNPTIIVNNSIVNPWGYIAAKSEGLPLVWMVHEHGDLDHGIPFIHGVDATREFVVRASDLVICCSEAVKKELLGKNADAGGKVHTIYNLLRSEKVIEMSKASVKPPFSQNKTLKLCAIGTLSEGKGQMYAIEAMGLLKEQGVETELIILGQGSKSYRAALEKKIKELDLQASVKFLGFQDNPYPFIKAADAVVVASRNEAFGRAAAEAMILGTPVIASNRGGSLEMIEDGKTGFLFKSTDPVSLADAVKRLKTTDRADLQDLVKAADRKIKDLLDTDKNTDKLTKLINRLDSRPTAAENKKIMTSEWVDAANAYEQEVLKATDELSRAKSEAAVQQQINVELLAAIDDMRNSQSYRLARKFSKVKQTIRRTKK